jgi:hypothetical protein
MRITYEKTIDQIKESIIANEFAFHVKAIAKKLPSFYQADYAFFRNKKMVCLCEIKNRNKEYPTLLLSLHKWDWLNRIHKEFNLACIILWTFPVNEKTQCWYFYIDNQVLDIEWGGRNDRQDDQDCEPVVMIPKLWFKPAFELLTDLKSLANNK